MTYALKTPFICDLYEGEYPVNFAGMNPRPYRAIFKASGKFTDGVRRQDYKVEEYVAQCKDLGIKYGLYHFLRPNSIAEQAELFLTVIDKVGLGNMPPTVDVEIDPQKVNVGFATWQLHVKTFLDIVEGALLVKPIIYTNQYYWKFLGAPPVWTDEYPLWMAWYTTPASPDLYSAPPRDRWLTRPAPRPSPPSPPAPALSEQLPDRTVSVFFGP